MLSPSMHYGASKASFLSAVCVLILPEYCLSFCSWLRCSQRRSHGNDFSPRQQHWSCTKKYNIINGLCDSESVICMIENKSQRLTAGLTFFFLLWLLADAAPCVSGNGCPAFCALLTLSESEQWLEQPGDSSIRFLIKTWHWRLNTSTIHDSGDD